MTPAADLVLETASIRRDHAPAFAPGEDVSLRVALKRCPPGTYEAAFRYRQTGDTAQLPAIVLGVIERYVERDLRPRLRHASPDLLLADDLSIDSLTMMEIVLLAEDVLRISITSEELLRLRSLGDVQRFIAAKVSGRPLPTPVVLPPARPCACPPSPAAPQNSLPVKPHRPSPPPPTIRLSSIR